MRAVRARRQSGCPYRRRRVELSVPERWRMKQLGALCELPECHPPRAHLLHRAGEIRRGGRGPALSMCADEHGETTFALHGAVHGAPPTLMSGFPLLSSQQYTPPPRTCRVVPCGRAWMARFGANIVCDYAEVRSSLSRNERSVGGRLVRVDRGDIAEAVNQPLGRGWMGHKCCNLYALTPFITGLKPDITA